MDKSICKKCMWFHTEEHYPICDRIRESPQHECYRFYKLPDDMLKEQVGEFECHHCGRKRDPGKCWWCGND